MQKKKSIFEKKVWQNMILAWYILRFHIGPFLFGTLTVMFIFLMQFLIVNIDKLLGKGLEPLVIVQVVGYSLAWMVVLAVPMGVLFSTLMAFGNMSAAQEVGIMKTSGISVVKMMAPSILLGVVLSYGMYRFNDDVLPNTNHAFKVLMQDIQRLKPTFALEAGRFSAQLEGYTILPRRTDESGLLMGVTIYDYMGSNRYNVISADTGIVNFSDNGQHVIIDLFGGEIHQHNRLQRGDYRHIQFLRHRIRIPARDFSFSRSDEGVFSRGDREMNIAAMEELSSQARTTASKADSMAKKTIALHVSTLLDSTDRNMSSVHDLKNKLTDQEALQRAIDRLEMARSNVESELFQYRDAKKRADELDVEIYKKYAIPMACLLLVFVGAPLGALSKRGNFGGSAAISLAFYIFYWAMLIMGEKLADRGALTPIAGMWMGNVIIGVFGLIITLRINYETFPWSGIVFWRKRQ